MNTSPPADAMLTCCMRPCQEPLREKRQRVDELLEMLALQGCKDTYIGDALARGISGGQVGPCACAARSTAGSCLSWPSQVHLGQGSGPAQGPGTCDLHAEVLKGASKTACIQPCLGQLLDMTSTANLVPGSSVLLEGRPGLLS